MPKSSSGRMASLLVSVVFLLVASLIALAVWFFLGLLPKDLDSNPLGTVLTNVATVGGVASGLSLAGYSTALAGTRGMAQLRKRYGSSVKFILLGGYVCMVISCMACAVASGFDYSEAIRLLAAGATGIITSGLVITAMLINSMFGWDRTAEHLVDE